MNPKLSKWLCYYPSVLAKGELVPFFRRGYERSQWWSEEQLRQHQLEAFRKIVSHAIKNSVLYRQLYQAVGVGSGADIRSLDDISKLPTIDKQTLIDHRDQIYTKTLLPAGTKTTGGSTGHPVQIRKNIGALARERAITWRAYAWAGIEVGDHQARFWGIPHTSKGRFQAHIADLVANRTRISAFDMGRGQLEKYYEQLRRVQPAYLYGYVSAIRQLADYVVETWQPPLAGLKAVVTTAEVLDQGARERIENAFQIRVFNEYGCGEVGSVAHECDAGSLHVMAENLLVEVDAPAPGVSGELIVTDFYNTATPLIRYRIGDFATAETGQCSCGRGLPVLSAVHGRAYDLLRLSSGKVVHPEAIIYVFENLQARTHAFKQFQVIQKTVNLVELRVVAAQAWSSDAKEGLIAGVKNALEPTMEVRVELVPTLARERSGKMRLVKSEVR